MEVRIATAASLEKNLAKIYKFKLYVSFDLATSILEMCSTGICTHMHKEIDAIVFTVALFIVEKISNSLKVQ